MHSKCWGITYQSMCRKSPTHAKIEESSGEGTACQMNKQYGFGVMTLQYKEDFGIKGVISIINRNYH